MGDVALSITIIVNHWNRSPGTEEKFILDKTVISLKPSPSLTKIKFMSL